MTDDAPFGTHAAPGFIEKARQMSAHGKTRLARYVGRKTIARYYKLKKRAFDTEVSGFKLRLYPHLNIHDKYALTYCCFPDESWSQKLLADAKAGDVFFDIGANVGAFSLFAQTHCDDGLKIFAFEPHPRTRAKLEMNLGFNDATRVNVIPKGIADFTGTATLFENAANNEGSSSLHNFKQADIPSVDVDIDTLENIMASLNLTKVDLLKIDIEGFEDKALIPFFRDMPDTAWPRRVLIEHVGSEHWDDDLIAYMTDKGYTITDKGHDDTLLEYPGA